MHYRAVTDIGPIICERYNKLNRLNVQNIVHICHQTAAIRLIYCNIPSHDFHYSAQINVTITADCVNIATALVLKLQTSEVIFNLHYLFYCTIINSFCIFHFKQNHNSSNQTIASFTNSLRSQTTLPTIDSCFFIVIIIKGPLICKDNLIFLT